MARFTKELRQHLVRDFAERNGGWYDPAAFLTEIEQAGSTHPAWEWFEWDNGKAALEYRLDQARDFARGLVIRFEVEEVHRGKLRISQRSVPLVFSPLAGRRDGGGYQITDPSSQAHMDELRRQAAQSLRWFISRYDAVLAHSGVSLSSFERAQALLEGGEHQEAA